MSGAGLALVALVVAACLAPVAALVPVLQHRRRPTTVVLAVLLAVAVVATVLDGRATGALGDLAALLAVVLAVAGGAVVTSAVLSWVGGSDERDSPAAEVLRGGTWIGVLERLALVGTLAAGWPEGAAVVVAVKGLGRYPELRGGSEPTGANERFIVGTLVSLVWAGLCAYVGLAPLRLA